MSAMASKNTALLKPSKSPNTSISTKITVQPPNNSHPLSIADIDSFRSEDGFSPPPPDPTIHTYAPNLGIKRNNSANRSSSYLAKYKIQRAISTRFGNNKPVIKRALSQFLADEEFDAKSMKTDLKDKDGYIIDHLADKFNWDTDTRQKFYLEVTDALDEDEISQHNKDHMILLPPYDDQSLLRKTETERTAALNANHHEEEHKYMSDNTNGDNRGSITRFSTDRTNQSLNTDSKTDLSPSPELKTTTLTTSQPASPTFTSLKAGGSYRAESNLATPNMSTLIPNYSTLSADESVGMDVPRSYTEMGRTLKDDDVDTALLMNNAKKKTRYPEYVIKAIFYAADDEHVEVLLDQAINFIANDPRFNYLWHDEEFLKSLYTDKLYSAGVERVMREIQDIAQNDDGADFFHQFVYREYDRERKDYLRELLGAREDSKYRETAHGLEASRNSTELYANESIGRTQSISDRTMRSKYTIKYVNSYSGYSDGGKKSDGLDIMFKIRPKKAKDDKAYIGAKTEYFELPNCAPDKKFMWAQYQTKKVKRFGRGSKAHSYWKLLKCEKKDETKQKDSVVIETKRNSKGGKITEMTELKTIKEGDESGTGKKGKKKKAKKRAPVPVQHLNLILGLMRFYLKQKKLDKDKTWIWPKCSAAFDFKDKSEQKKDDRREDKKDILIQIDDGQNKNVEYKITWYNGGDAFDECVALAVRKRDNPKKFYFYMCFKADIEDKIEWQWYNNDESYFQKYDLGFEVFAQLEANFQANLHTNFPFNILPKHAGKASKTRESPFNLPCVPEMTKALKKKRIGSSAQHYIIRYLFTKSKRIQDMEQLSVNKNQPEYARRIKRMIAGTNQSTLFAYFLKTSDFVDEWKERFLLSDETQVYFFWSFILAIATTMKYMELELENQFITFSFRRDNNVKQNTSCINKLDTSDLRREIRDLDLFAGFIVPPLQIMQTQDVEDNADIHVTAHDWYRRLSTVGILKKIHYYDNFGGTLREKAECERVKTNERYDTCPHSFAMHEYPWEGALGTVYCDRCANMMRFGEYLRKFCLEYENRDLIQFLWPWHKNTFHCKDRQKYHEAITRQNFNFLFDSEDLLHYVPTQNNMQLIGEFFGGNNEEDEEDLTRGKSLSKGGKTHNHLAYELRKERSMQLNREKVFEAHIRHKRKYSARFMLGAWESLKNLNIIKVQMGAVFEQLEIDRVHAEVAYAAKESIDVKFYKEKISELIEVKQKDLDRRKLSHDLRSIAEDMYVSENDYQEITSVKPWKLQPKDWAQWLSAWNKELQIRLQKNHWLMILKLNKFKELDIADMCPKQLPNWNSFLTWALSPAYTSIDSGDGDGDGNESGSDYDSDSDNPGFYDRPSRLNAVKSEASLQKKMMNEWKKQFRSSWTRVPHWWHIGHDKVLIELAVQCQFNERKYYDSLTKRAAYFRMRLNESIGEQDYTQDVAFQEFKNWCIRWENIMHRVRYISAVVARQISSVTPSIVEILIDDPKDRPTWDCTSLVFLNDNQRDAHIERIRGLPKPAGWEKTMERKKVSFEDEELSIVESHERYREDEEENDHLIAAFQHSAKSKARLCPKFKKTKTEYIREEKERHTVDNKIDWAKLFKECRTRDPFMIRDLGFELKEILNTFDLVTYGEPMSRFVIELLRTRNLRSLWTFLGVLLKTMPNKVSLRVLYNNRTQLRRAKPQDLDWICRQVIQGTRFIVPACLFLSHFMKENARDDLARNGVWEDFSNKYEEFAAEQVSSIEDDFMLTMLMFIPVYMKEISLIQLALEQHNTLFLNTERVNRMVTHTWFTVNPLNPHIEMLSHTKNPKRNLRDAFAILLRKPLYFYLTPFGHQWCISLFFTFYVSCIIAWMIICSTSNMTKKTGNWEANGHVAQLYSTTMSWFERVIWFMNLGFVCTEYVQFYSLGRSYFSVDGATNVWDIGMSTIWCILAGIRFWFFLTPYHGILKDPSPLYIPPASSFTRRRRRRQLPAAADGDKYYCPDDFFSCKIAYNESCMAEISGEDNEIIDLECDYSNDRRILQDSNFDSNMLGFDDVDNFYDEEFEESTKTWFIDDTTGKNCTNYNATIKYNTIVENSYHNATTDIWFWNETCVNFNQSINVNFSNVNGTNTNGTFPDCIIPKTKCSEYTTFDTQLLLIYNGLWSAQVAMLTMRLLSYFESAGGFFGILLRIVRAMIIEVLKFGVIIMIVSTGFLFAIWYLFSTDINTAATNAFTDLYDVVIFFFKLLFGGGNVGTIDTFYQNYRVYAQLMTMIFAILGVRMFMSLLIALMSGAMNEVRKQAKAETSFTSAQYAYELSRSPRMMPMPLNVVAIIISVVLHALNFIPAMISPQHLNIYAYISQKRLYGLACFSRRSARKSEIKSINHMNTRSRVFQYYLSLSPVCALFVSCKSRHDWRIHHIGCYNTLTGIYGTEELQCVSTNEYYNILEGKRKNFGENRKLNVYDKLFLKHLTLQTMFCRHCFRPVILSDVRSTLITPVQALSNIVSCYMFLLIWPFFIPFFYAMCQVEKLIQYWTEELRAHSPTMLGSRQREYDLEYFPRSSVRHLSVRNKTERDLKRLGTGGPDVTDVDVNYDEIDDAT